MCVTLARAIPRYREQSSLGYRPFHDALNWAIGKDRGVKNPKGVVVLTDGADNSIAMRKVENGLEFVRIALGIDPRNFPAENLEGKDGFKGPQAGGKISGNHQSRPGAGFGEVHFNIAGSKCLRRAKCAIFSFSVSVVFAAGILPPPSDQNSDSSESNSTSPALSPFFTLSKKCAIKSRDPGEFFANRGADCTAARARCAVIRQASSDLSSRAEISR